MPKVSPWVATAYLCGFGAIAMGAYVAFVGAIDSLVVAVVLVVMSTTTYALSFDSRNSKKLREGNNRLPPPPGNILEQILYTLHYLYDQAGFLERMRDVFPEGIFSLKLSGKKHVFIHNPELSAALLSHPRDNVEAGGFRTELLQDAFGFSKRDAEKYHVGRDLLIKPMATLAADVTLNKLLQVNLVEMNRTIADMVTFNSSPADQMDWEVMAGAEIVEDKNGTQYVELDWMKMMTNYIGRTASTALFGSDFVYNFPEIWSDLETFDKGFKDLTAKKPWWIPQPMRRLATQARARLLDYMRDYNEALGKHLAGEDVGVKWQDIEQTHEVNKARYNVYKTQTLGVDGMACANFSFFWGVHTNTSPLTAWMIYEISRDPVFLEQIREEIAPYVQIYEEENPFGDAVWLPPRFQTVDLDGLLKKCVLLKASYIETLRLYTSSWSTRELTQDLFVNMKAQTHRPYILSKSTIAHVTQGVHQMDPVYYEDPDEWQPERHISVLLHPDGKTMRDAGMGVMKPFGTSCSIWGRKQKANRDV